MEITTIGLDLAKNVFQVHAINGGVERQEDAFDWAIRVGGRMAAPPS
jgi:hypothetical protein